MASLAYICCTNTSVYYHASSNSAPPILLINALYIITYVQICRQCKDVEKLDLLVDLARSCLPQREAEVSTIAGRIRAGWCNEGGGTESIDESKEAGMESDVAEETHTQL